MQRTMTKEWNAESYHKVAAPQTAWGQKVLSRLEVAGNENVIDAGCGTGRLTGELMTRLPKGRLVAIDRSWNMLLTARANLRPDFGSRVSYARVELPHLPFAGWADLLFSTATFHWVRDHEALFANIFQALRSGGRLFAQCGGGRNLARARALADSVMQREPFARFFEDWTSVWEYASPEITSDRLRAAGFIEIETWLEEAPTTLADESNYREFVTTVIYNQHLARIPDADLRARFIDDISALSARESTPFTLDYWRLNMEARRP